MRATILPEKIGENLKRLIKESKYRTQGSFALAIGKDIRTVRRWVSGRIDSLDMVFEIAKLLDVDAMALLF